MQQLSGIRIGKRKALVLGGVEAVAVFAMWLVWGFNRGSSDEAKYEQLQGLARTCERLKSMDQWLSPRVSKFIRLHDFRTHERYRHDLLRIELLTSGYLTNATFEVTNYFVALPRISSGLVKAFGAEARVSGILLLMPSRDLSQRLVTITCRSQDLVLLGEIVSGDSNAPAKPIKEIPALFEGDIPVLQRGKGFER
jgi:hypothetical protein